MDGQVRETTKENGTGEKEREMGGSKRKGRDSGLSVRKSNLTLASRSRIDSLLEKRPADTSAPPRTERPKAFPFG